MTPEVERQIKDLLANGDEIKAIALLRETEKLRLSTAKERIAAMKLRLQNKEPQNAAYIVSSIGQFVLISVVGLSGFLAIPSALHIFDYWGDEQWPTSSGKVIESKQTRTSVQGYYAPEILFEYTVAGNEYQSSRWGFPAVDAGLGSSTKEVLARYPKGAEVTVYFHPQHPDRAVLETSLKWQWVRVFTFLIGLPLYLWYRGFHARVEARSRARMLAG